MIPVDLTNVVSAEDYEKVCVGGYVCKITNVTVEPKKEYITIFYDIVEGKFKNHYADLNAAKGFWAGKFIKSYKQDCLAYFKSFIDVIEETNKNYKWSQNEQLLIGKGIGLVLGEEEYRANNGTIKTRLYVDKFKTAEQIRKSEFIIPEFKKLSEKIPSASLKPVDNNDDLPF